MPTHAGRMPKGESSVYSADCSLSRGIDGSTQRRTDRGGVGEHYVDTAKVCSTVWASCAVTAGGAACSGRMVGGGEVGCVDGVEGCDRRCRRLHRTNGCEGSASMTRAKRFTASSI